MATVTGSILIRHKPSDTGTPTFTTAGDYSYTGDGSSGILMWNAQEESGTAPTSDIHTVGSTVTRLADDVNKATSELPWADGAAGSLVDAINSRDVTSFHTTNINGGNSNNRIAIYTASSSFRCLMTDGGVSEANDLIGSASNNTDHKVSMAWDTNDVRGALDGVLGSENTTATLPTSLTAVDFGKRSNATNANLNGISKYTIYRARQISDADLQTETT